MELRRIPGKRHGMIHGAAEMRLIMAFWAERLGRRPVEVGAEGLIEVSC